MSAPVYPQYFGSLSAMLEFIVESDADLAEHAEFMAAHPDAVHIRWKDGVPLDDEKALAEASVNAIVGDWLDQHVEVKEVDGRTMFRLRDDHPCAISSGD